MNNRFDIDFLRENMMGPNCVRILEELSEDFTLKPDARVLDLGCGRGLTSIFLAEEFGARVFATDLWIPAAENFQRFKQLGLDDRITPIHAEAHELPFAEGFFDAIVSIDAYYYFGAKEGFLDRYMAPLVKKDGLIAIAVPGLKKDFDAEIPEELVPFWEEDMNFFSLKWWQDLWSRAETIELTHCRSLRCHEEAWQDWLQCDNPYAKRDIEMLKAEGGRYFDTIGMIAKKTGDAENREPASGS
ncbi:MAG: methyltransferase domain-containing protein [Firmicutes bacterium]|nr:methyltransferase domain-containing protein [Bacillota bacterium]